MKTFAFSEMPQVSEAGEYKKYSVFEDGLIITVDRILMAKLGGKNRFICLPTVCKHTLLSPVYLEPNW